jgi:hypothetical protein
VIGLARFAAGSAKAVQYYRGFAGWGVRLADRPFTEDANQRASWVVKKPFPDKILLVW